MRGRAQGGEGRRGRTAAALVADRDRIVASCWAQELEVEVEEWLHSPCGEDVVWAASLEPGVLLSLSHVHMAVVVCFCWVAAQQVPVEGVVQMVYHNICICLGRNTQTRK